jgi:N-acetylmuramoyl-L-alanine amidase
LLLAFFLLISVIGSKTVNVISANAPIENRKTVVIDAGHGGIDGGAVSCTGVLESNLNLEIALRLDDLMHLLGINTLMIRTTDCSVHTKGETIAQKKVSDLKERVRVTNSVPNAVLVSIHQNLFSDSKYSGAQVFFAPTSGSKEMADALQSELIKNLNPGSRRQIKKADSVYLMQHITCPGILVECGFISNPQEEYLLRSEGYQKKLCCVIASTVSMYLFSS